MSKIIGIGGIFFKAKDPEKLKEWYKEHLGFEVNAYGTKFDSKTLTNFSENSSTQWSPFKEDTDYFLNLPVKNL